MTRYILFPKSSNSCFTLHSTISDDSKDIFIPSDIVCDISIFDDVHNKIRLKNQLFVLSENGIFRTKMALLVVNTALLISNIIKRSLTLVIISLKKNLKSFIVCFEIIILHFKAIKNLKSFVVYFMILYFLN